MTEVLTSDCKPTDRSLRWTASRGLRVSINMAELLEEDLGILRARNSRGEIELIST